MTDELSTVALKYCAAGLSGYDAVYVALAEILDALWPTFDKKVHKKLLPMDRSISLHEGIPDFSARGEESGRHRSFASTHAATLPP